MKNDINRHGLTPELRDIRWGRAIIALLEEATVEKAAAAANVSPATLRRWMAVEEFKGRLRQAERKCLSREFARLQRAAGLAVDTLIRVMKNKTATDAACVHAAECVLKYAYKGTEQEDLAVEIAQLKKLVKDQLGQRDGPNATAAFESRLTVVQRESQVGNDWQDCRRDRAILALLEQPTIAKAAEAVGVARATLWRWNESAEFQERLRQVRHQCMSVALTRLQRAAGPAVDTVIRVMTAKTATDTACVRAAQCVLKYAYISREQEDLAVEIAQLKKLVRDQLYQQESPNATTGFRAIESRLTVIQGGNLSEVG